VATAVEDDREGAGREEREISLGPLFTAGILLLVYGLIRRRPLAVAGGLGSIWLDQRSRLGRALKQRVRGLSPQPEEDDRQPGR
jgi:hypothetical protein